MANYTNLTSLFTATANAIRAKDGTTATIKPVDFPDRIAAINTVKNQSKSNISPSTSSQTITPDSGYTGLSSVQINAMPAMTLPTAASSSSSGTSKATITPSTSAAQYLNIPTGYNSTASYYTIDKISTRTQDDSLVVNCDPNADITYDGSTKPYSKVVVYGYVRGYTTSTIFPRVTTASPSAYNSATTYYQISMSTAKSISSSTYYIWGTISISGGHPYDVGGKMIPTNTLYPMGWLYTAYRTSYTGTMTTASLKFYLYYSGDVIYIVSTTRAFYVPATSTYSLYFMFETPILFLTNRTSVAITAGSYTVNTTSYQYRYSATRLFADSVVNQNKTYYTLATEPSTFTKAIGWTNMYRWSGFSMYYDGSAFKINPIVTTLTIG